MKGHFCGTTISSEFGHAALNKINTLYVYSALRFAKAFDIPFDSFNSPARWVRDFHIYFMEELTEVPRH